VDKRRRLRSTEGSLLVSGRTRFDLDRAAA